MSKGTIKEQALIVQELRHKHIIKANTKTRLKTMSHKETLKPQDPIKNGQLNITEFKVESTSNGGNGKTYQKLYLSPIINLFNGEIVSDALNERPTYDLVKEMLDDALNKLSQANKDDKPIIHSDRGWHYQMFHYQQTLKEQGLIQSMSRKDNCLDNAVIERLEGTLKQEIFYEQITFTSINELKTTIDEYIHYYNDDRIKTKLKGLSPVKYRNLVLSQTA